MRLGLSQRYLFRDQLVTPDGVPLTQRFSDVLLLGSTTLMPDWTLDGSVQYSPDLKRSVRSIVGARYSPGPFRTVERHLPLDARPERAGRTGLAVADLRPQRRRAQASGGCSGALYTVGRVNYSLSDSRVTDSVLGVEYDAGCWIGRVVAERLSTGRSEATTRLMLQLELVGLSRLGSNPLQVLKDNIPGYRCCATTRSTLDRLPVPYD